MAREQEAEFHYLQWKELYNVEKPYEIFIDDVAKLKGMERTNLEFKPGKKELVSDARGQEARYTLDTNGFAWRQHHVDVASLKNESWVIDHYLPEMERYLRKELEGADKVVMFDWRVRLSMQDEDFEKRTIDLNDKLDPLQPARYPHIDQTPDGAAVRAYHHLKVDAEHLMKGRFRIINIWRPLSPVDNWPLALCDARSVQPTDLVETDFIRRRYQGETYFALESGTYKWFYLSEQQPDEITLLKIYDSSKHTDAKFCLHASFPLDNESNRRPRESIECRALVFTYPVDEKTSQGAVTTSTSDPTTAAKISGLSQVYGTAWKGDKTATLVGSGIDAGLRAFDTAAQPQHYNEHLTGQAVLAALARAKLTRDELWLQTKFTSASGQQDTLNCPYDPAAPIAEQVHSSIAQSLQHFFGSSSPTTDAYFDCVFLHAPYPTFPETLEAWNALSTYVPHQIRVLGISNISYTDLATLYERARIKPRVVQNPFSSATLYDALVRRFCQKYNITYQAFGVLRQPQVLECEPVCALAAEIGGPVGVEQALYGLLRALEILPLCGTARVERMRANVKAMEAIARWKCASERNAAVWRRIRDRFENVLVSCEVRAALAAVQ